MATATKTTKATEVKDAKEFAKASILLWKETSKKGSQYFQSKFHTAFYNTNKKNPNEPDLRVYRNYADGEVDTSKEYASLWCNVSEKTGNKYLSGHLNDEGKTKLIGFIRKEKKSEKAPDIDIYLQSEWDKYHPRTEGAAKVETKAEQEDLPF